MWYDENGKQYKSSVKVERVFRQRGLLARVSDTETETGGETSEYEPSPIKKPRIDDV